MCAKLGDLIKEAGYSEMYGVELCAPAEGYWLSCLSTKTRVLDKLTQRIRNKAAPFTTLLVLQKFLRANANDVAEACEQLLGALKWRREFKPLEVKKQVFDEEKYQGLGYVTELEGVPESPNDVDVATFNIYGAVKDTKKTFGDLDE